ncbi:MAG: phosphotransferase [Actinomycetota bacterium]|nr:phosphotransferase [Actinomycetota bacterium]
MTDIGVPMPEERSTNVDLRASAAIVAHVAAAHAAEIVGVDPFFDEPEMSVRRLHRARGGPWVAQVFEPAQPFERVRGDGAVLTFLACQRILAEPVASARDQGLAVEVGRRGVLVTRGVSDRDPRIDRRRLEALGDQLGRIHAMDAGDDVHTSRTAGSLPTEDLATARSRLDAIADRLPPRYEPVYEALVEAIGHTDDCSDHRAPLDRATTRSG